MTPIPKLCLSVAVLLAGLAAPTIASAADGIAIESGALRAGPGRDYPDVDHIENGDRLQVYGCLENYDWCDVSNEDNRGWFPGSRIAFIRHGHRVTLPEIAPEIGIGILGFGVEEYWRAHYRSRPFFGDARRFEGHDHPGAGGPIRVGPPRVETPYGGQPPHQGEQRRVVPPVIRNDARPPVVHNEARPPVIHNEVRPPVVHNEARPPVIHNEVRPPVVHNEARPPIVHEVPRPPVNNGCNDKNCANR